MLEKRKKGMFDRRINSSIQEKTFNKFCQEILRTINIFTAKDPNFKNALQNKLLIKLSISAKEISIAVGRKTPKKKNIK